MSDENQMDEYTEIDPAHHRSGGSDIKSDQAATDNGDPPRTPYEIAWPDNDFSHPMCLFSIVECERRIREIKEFANVHDDDIARRDAVLLKTLKFRTGNYRELSMPSLRWRVELDELAIKFPNFGEVIEYLRAAFALAEIRNQPPQLQPMLLVGPAGLGKSYFASELASVLRTTKITVEMNTAQANSILSGSSAFWANAAPGVLFKTLIGGEANPLFVLEEVDKISTNAQTSPESSLFQLLEPGTSKHWADLCFEWLHLDASKINFVCTANDATPISGALLSRLRVFHLDMPINGTALVHSIFDSVLAEMAVFELRGMALHPDVVQIVSSLSPRTIRSSLVQALGAAVLKGRRKVVMPSDVTPPREQIKRKIGF